MVLLLTILAGQGNKVGVKLSMVMMISVLNVVNKLVDVCYLLMLVDVYCVQWWVYVGTLID